MLRNPLARHVAWFLAIKAALIALGVWWFVGSMPEPRGALPPAGLGPDKPAAAGVAPAKP